jgi:hypothetical protein
MLKKKQFVIANVVWRSVGNEIASTTPHFETSLLVASSHLGFAKKIFQGSRATKTKY